MSYIRKVVSADERLVLITRLHWIYIAQGIFWFALLTAGGLWLDHIIQIYSHYKIIGHDINFYYFKISAQYTQPSFICILIGFALFSVMFTKYISTEIGLTDRRVIQKRGLIMIEVEQVELEDIRGESVHHGWLGWLLGYGRLHFDCRFIDDVTLLATPNPYRVIKAVHTARMRNDRIPHYGEPELDTDIIRIDQQRNQAYRAQKKLKKMTRILPLPSPTEPKESKT